MEEREISLQIIILFNKKIFFLLSEQTVVSVVRFALMEFNDFFEIVEPSAIFNTKQLLDINRNKTYSKRLLLRRQLGPSGNEASADYKTKLTSDDFKLALLNGDVKNYDIGKGKK